MAGAASDDFKVDKCTVFINVLGMSGKNYGSEEYGSKKIAVSLPRLKCLEDMEPKKYFSVEELKNNQPQNTNCTVKKSTGKELLKPLTHREKQVTRMLKVMSVSKVASELNLSKSTIRHFASVAKRKRLILASRKNND